MPRCSSVYWLVPVFFLLTSCANSLPSSPTAPGTTITPNPNATPSLTPFGPSVDLPALTPTLPLPPLPASQTPQDTSTFAPAPITGHAAAAYVLDATLNYAAHSLSVDETITYQNSTGESLTGLVLAVEPDLWKGCFVLGGLMVDGQMLNDYKLYGDRLEIPFAASLALGANINLLMHYDLNLPPADTHHIFGYNDHQINLVDWYPFIVPYANGWLLHPPANVGEHLVYNDSVVDLTLRLADPSLPVTVAASAPAEANNSVWRYHLQNARTFVFSASTAYQAASTTVNGIQITGYYFESEKAPARAALDQVAKALRTFSTLFGPYPYPGLSMVESPYFDGMEYDGLFFLSRDYYIAADGTVLNNLVDIAVHETAHQWWFGSVGSDQALEPWLDEALATYSERLFYEQNYPEVTAWQAFRIDDFDPSGWVDTDIYHGVDFRTYANAVYLRGARFLQALRGRVGDEAFFAFLKDYAAQMAGKLSSSADFFNILRQHTSRDLSDIIQTYFQNPP